MDLRLLDKFNELARNFEEQENKKLLEAAGLMADAIEQDRLIYIFGGGGHTCLVMQELFWRAGGLANLCPMIDFAIHPVTPAYMYLAHDCALEAKKRGAHTVGVSSSDWNKNIPKDFPIRHKSGKHLSDIVAVFIEDFVPYGDTVIEVEGMKQPITGISSTIDFYIAHRLEMECVKECIARGIEPPVWSSANIPGGDEKNRILRAKYNSRVKFL